MKKTYILFLMSSLISIPLMPSERYTKPDQQSEPYTRSGQQSVWWQATASMGFPGFTADDDGYLASMLQMEQLNLRVGAQAYLALQELQKQKDQEKK